MPIKPAEMSAIYYACCDAKGYKGSDEQLKLWNKTLGYAEKVDLQAALILHWSDNTDFPMPADLRHLVERSKRERLMESEGPKELVEYVCPQCHAPFSTVVAVGDYRPRICLVVDYRNQLTGCRVRLREVGRGYRIGNQKRA
jgi:hypothetical protein